MDYFITLNEKSIDAIGEAVEKPITVIEGLKDDIADLEQTVAEKDETIAQKDEIIAGKDDEIAALEDAIFENYPITLSVSVRNTQSNPVAVSSAKNVIGGYPINQPQVTKINTNSTATFEITGVFNLKRYSNAAFSDFVFLDVSTGNLNIYGFSTLAIHAGSTDYATASSGANAKVNLNVANIKRDKVHHILCDATI